MKRRNMTIATLMMSAILTVSSTGCMQLFSASSNNYSNADQYTAGSTEFDGTQVDTLDINWIDGSVSVTRYDGDTVTITESSEKELTEAQTVHTWLDGSTLHIQYCKSGELLTGKNLEKSLEIQLPKDLELKKVGVEAASTDTVVEDISAKEFDVDIASGTTKLQHCSGDSFSIDSESGDTIVEQVGESIEITVNAASGKVSVTADTVISTNVGTASGAVCLNLKDTKTVDANTASGNVELHYLTIPEKTNVDTASGDVFVYVPAEADFAMEVDTASGNFTTDMALKKSGDTYIIGNGTSTSKMTIDTASGDVNVAVEE